MSAACADAGLRGTHDLDSVPRSGILSIISAAAAILLAVQVGANFGANCCPAFGPCLTPCLPSSYVQVVIQTHPTNAWTLNHTNMALAFFSSVRSTPGRATRPHR
jgi:hypothetical protein